MNPYYDQTVLHPLGIAAVLILGLVVLLVPRRFALVPMLVLACFISPAQRFVILGLDFSLIRILVLFGWTRVLLFNESAGFRWRPFDILLVLWIGAGSAIAWFREGDASTLIYRLGIGYDALGMILLFRVLIRSWTDVETLVRAIALLGIPVAAVFIVEQVTGRNMFSIFGGVSLVTVVREGRIRCLGPFAHAIYAGCFWASLVPCLGALWWGARGWRWLAPIGIFAATTIVATTASSTPVIALAIAIVAWCAYPLRNHLHLARWAMLGGTVALHIVMIAPVWHLIARLNVVGGSTGWYRYRLIDGFIRRFDLWWLEGSRDYNAIWGEYFNAITNHFILEGLEGGLIGLVFFVAMIAVAFGGIGRARRLASPLPFPRIMAWAMGVSLFVHCVNFLAVSYFGQVLMEFYLVLAICASMTPVAGARLVRVAAVRPRAAWGLRLET